MSQPVSSTPDPKEFNINNVKLRDELKLTDKQRANTRHFFESDWKPAFINVLPTTVVVHRELAEKRLDIKGCIFITGANADTMTVFAAPKFCCRKPVNRVALVPQLNSFVNIEKCDLKVIAPTDTSPEMTADFGKQSCILCRDDGKIERDLFGLSCGHLLCRRCWLGHCKYFLGGGVAPIPCMKPGCKEILTISRAATLLSDSALGVILELEWRHKLRKKDNLQCAGCLHWLQRNDCYRKVLSAGCQCGCYTCVRCGHLEHSPLRCKDAAIWSEIRSKETEDEQAAEAEKVWTLSRDDFDECLAPLKALDSGQFKKNIRFMKTNDRLHGKKLERDMRMVARMVEMRRVQQLAHKKEMMKNYDTYYGDTSPDERWLNLEQLFRRGLDTVGETKAKAVHLDKCREVVLYYYNY